MEGYDEKFLEEEEYLEETLKLISKELGYEEEKSVHRKTELIAARRDMWENTVHFTNDFDRLTEINQHLTETNNQTATYVDSLKRINKYKKMNITPYFGRFDFIESGSEEIEKIYVGISNLMNTKTNAVYIYDWRAPISSIFYRYELGSAEYSAPMGLIAGDVSIKRQYKIKNSKLEYFFDCSIKIDDEMLQEILGHNSSTKMKNIVETIQKEQDIIIRDMDNELLIVQGVAGSGKTSIALHRIAFLLYQGLNSGLVSENILIISPNDVFGKYISSVLPELGEENVSQKTFGDFVEVLLKKSVNIQDRNTQLESLLVSKNEEEINRLKKSIEFKGSKTFIKILDRFIRYCERNIINFEDVYYDGKIIKTRDEMKNFFLNNKINMPITKRLKRIENMIFDKIHSMQRERVKKIEKIVAKLEGHEFDIKIFSRLMSLKESKVLANRIRKFTEIDYFELYTMLFKKKGLLQKLALGLKLPDDIESIINMTSENIGKGHIPYEDCGPILYLKLKLEGSSQFPGIRQVVIDEAQDYYPIQYEVINLLFKDARYTVLGDMNQSIERAADKTIYDSISDIFNKNKTVKLFLNKSYRSSFEINEFNLKLLNKKEEIISFDRHEAKPIVIYKENSDLADGAIVDDIEGYFGQGYESIAIICKTRHEAELVYERLNKLINIKLISIGDEEVGKGVIIIPSYMAKGLEFDVVIVNDAANTNYSTELDRRLLYIACTRALHRLVIYHTGDRSHFVM